MKPMGGRTWKYWPASGPLFVWVLSLLASQDYGLRAQKRFGLFGLMVTFAGVKAVKSLEKTHLTLIGLSVHLL